MVDVLSAFDYRNILSLLIFWCFEYSFVFLKGTFVYTNTRLFVFLIKVSLLRKKYDILKICEAALMDSTMDLEC
jgi:hypothetical protein